MLLIFLCIPIIFISGCSESSQLHRKLIVQGIGIDTEGDSYKITLEALDFQNPKSDSEPSIKIFNLYGTSVMDSLSNISMYTGLEALYSQNLILIVGEDTAYQGLSKVIDFFIRYSESRPNVKICVVKGGTASELLSNNQNSGCKSKDIYELIQSSLNSDIMHFVSRTKNQLSEPYVACFNIDKSKEDFQAVNDEIAVFSQDKLVGYLNKDEKIGLMLVSGMSNIGSLTVDLDDSIKATCKISAVNSIINASINDFNPEFLIDIKTKAELFEINKISDVGTQPELKKSLKQKLAEKLKQYSLQAINKSIELKSDVFNFGRILLNSNPGYLKSTGANWKDIMNNCNYNIKIETDIQITGKEIIN